MSKSYETVNYLFRPKKQIERKLIIETLQHLNSIMIRKYHYFGFGSVYFADFILFHKYLNIKKMTSIDNKVEDEKRFLFNKPFGFINFEVSRCHIFLEKKLNWEDKLFIWLDYDTDIDSSIISDVEYVASKAKSLDILLVTIEADSPTAPKDFLDDFRSYIPPKCKLKDIKENFPGTLSIIMNGVIRNGLNNQTKYMDFLQLFNIVYSDTKKMYTFGGIFCKKGNINNLKEELRGLRYIRYDNVIENIDCPLLTPREKMYIDRYIQRSCVGKEAKKTGLRKNELEKYRRYYKYYPQFFESLY